MDRHFENSGTTSHGSTTKTESSMMMQESSNKLTPSEIQDRIKPEYVCQTSKVPNQELGSSLPITCRIGSDQANVFSSCTSASDFNQSNSKACSTSLSGSKSGYDTKNAKDSMIGKSFELSTLAKHRLGESSFCCSFAEGAMQKHKQSIVGRILPGTTHRHNSNRARQNNKSTDSERQRQGIKRSSESYKLKERQLASSTSSVASALSMYSTMIDEVVKETYAKRRKQGRRASQNQVEIKNVEKERQETKDPQTAKLKSDTTRTNMEKETKVISLRACQKKEPANEMNDTKDVLFCAELISQKHPPQKIFRKASVDHKHPTDAVLSTDNKRNVHKNLHSTTSLEKKTQKKSNVGDIHFANSKEGQSISTVSSSQFHGKANHMNFLNPDQNTLRAQTKRLENTSEIKLKDIVASGTTSNIDQPTMSDLSWSGISSSKATSSAGTSQNSDESGKKTVPLAPLHTSENPIGSCISGEEREKTHGSSLEDDSGDRSGSLNPRIVKPNDQFNKDGQKEMNFAFTDKMISYSKNKNNIEDLPSSSCSDGAGSNSVESSGDERKEKATKKDTSERPTKVQANSQWQMAEDELSNSSFGDAQNDQDLLYSRLGAESPSSTMCAVCPCQCSVGSKQEQETKVKWMDLLEKRPTQQNESAVKDWLFEIMRVAQSPP